MSTEYPESIDSFPVQSDGGSVIDAAQLQNIQDAVAAVETVLGTEPAGSYDTVGDGLAAKVSKAGDSMSGELDMATHLITHLGTPSASDDAATKGYVDSSAQPVDGDLTAIAGLTGSGILTRMGDETWGLLTDPLPVANGGTASITAAGARSSLGAAASGANSDITSLSGLTTPLSTAQGGTGSTTGYSNPGSGSYSEHFGASSTASANLSTSVGANSGAIAIGATAVGAYASSEAENSCAIGCGSQSIAKYDTALGAYSQAAAEGNGSMGAKGALAVGYGAIAYGDGSIAIGQDASNQEEQSIILGKGAASTSANQFVVGSSAAPINEMTFGGAGCKISNVTDPTSAQDAATKNYVDTRTLSSFGAPTTDVSLASHKLTNVTDPTSAQDAATKVYVESTVAAINQFRLTLTSLNAAPTSDVTGATTVYLTPVANDGTVSDATSKIGLYCADKWAVYSTAQVQKSLGTLNSNKNYDVFVLWNGSTVVLDLVAWSTDTARATALTTQDGILVKSGDATSRYVGTLRTTTATTTEDSGGSSGSKRFLWNLYNHVDRDIVRVETIDNWQSGTSTAWAAVNATAAVWKHEFVIGLPNQRVRSHAQAYAQAASASTYILGLALNGTPSSRGNALYGNVIGGTSGVAVAEWNGGVGIGYQYLQGSEVTQAGVAATVYGDNGSGDGTGGNIKIQSGMITRLRA